ncbi:hypothetical protein HOLleu_27009 [Holothuria leucospilota]|uniref:Uncharacterized protein n=1 Tax=Holothuria leucospilota TaxID=206669 RepID=A0A9Q1H378_HOLLE|nr:hypothetical protein HOLleu_27009 [Holothuria leucospilota]
MAVTSLTILSAILSLFLISPVVSQHLIFELKDKQYQEIIFSGDVTVAIICKITDVATAEVTISLDGVLVATNNGEGNCLEFVISRIDSTDNVNITCSASYNKDVNMPSVTDTKTLILNVSGIDNSCFRNGTGINQPYQVGDVLLLSCYCRATEPCIWTETTVGSLKGRAISPTEQTLYNNKKISRIIVGPFNNTSINTSRYDCSHGSTVDSRCSIGPVENSVNDHILNPTDPSEIPPKCSVIDMFDKKDVSPTTEGISTASSRILSSKSVPVSQISTISSDEGFNVITYVLVIVIVACVIIVILVVCTVIVCSRIYRKIRCARRENSEDNSRQYNRTIYSVSNTNYTADYMYVHEEESNRTKDSAPTYESKIHQQPSTDKCTTYEETRHVYLGTDY